VSRRDDEYGTTGLPSKNRVLHLLKACGDLQDETGASRLFSAGLSARAGDTHSSRRNGHGLYLRTQAIARLVLDNFDHVGASWVTQGPDIGEIALASGRRLRSVMFEEERRVERGTTYASTRPRSRIDTSGRLSVGPAQRSLRLADRSGNDPRIVHADAVFPGRRPPPSRTVPVVLSDDGTVLDVGPAAEILPRHAGARSERRVAR